MLCVSKAYLIVFRIFVFQILTVGALMLHNSNAQIFPFSNLRAFFDVKTKQARDNSVHTYSTAPNITRPHRQVTQEPNLPALPEFDSPDIFTINRNIDNHRTYPVKRQPSSSEPTTPPPKRRGNAGRYRSRTEPTVQRPTEEESADSLYITPDPNPDPRQVGDDEQIAFQKIKPKSRSRVRKPQYVQDLERTVEPVEFGSMQITTDKEQVTLQYSDDQPRKQPTELTLPSEEPTYVESVPSLAVAIEQNQYDPSIGLIDYLVPPKLPSVYEKNFKRHKLRTSPTSSQPKLKPQPSTVYPKKENRFRIKKNRNEIKSTSIPLAERLTTTAKRHIVRHRRPNHHRDPARKPAGEKKPLRQLELQQQAAQMDEQITAETGFTGAASHPHPHNGNERVEFQMHGQKGPHSYKFGYDTGKGHNRQFRFEEKDDHGHVKGHYGYYDKEGKLQIVNYEADPHEGFKAESS